MRYPLILALVLFSSLSLADETWYENHWIYDLESSNREWLKAPDSWENVPCPKCKAVNQKFVERMNEDLRKSDLRELRIKDGLAMMKINGEWGSKSVYSIRPVSEGVFEVIFVNSLLKNIVRKTDEGFCISFRGEYDEPLPDYSFAYYQDCYKEYGTLQHNFDEAIQLARANYVKSNTQVALRLTNTIPTSSKAWIETLLKYDTIYEAPGKGPAFIEGYGSESTGSIGIVCDGPDEVTLIKPALDGKPKESITIRAVDEL